LQQFGNLIRQAPRFSDGRPEYVQQACERSLTRCKPM